MDGGRPPLPRVRWYRWVIQRHDTGERVSKEAYSLNDAFRALGLDRRDGLAVECWEGDRGVWHVDERGRTMPGAPPQLP